MVEAGSGPSKGEGGRAASAAGAGKGGAAAKKAVNKADADTLVGGSLMTVVVRNEFYREGFRGLMWVTVGEAIIIVLLLTTFISYINSVRVQDHYFATTADGRIMQLVPLELPNMGTSSLLSWAAQAGSEVMTFGFQDYQRRLQYSSRHFTPRGLKTFDDALQKSRIIKSIMAQHQVASAEPRSAPILIWQGVSNGKYRWVVDLPLTVKYQSSTDLRVDNMQVRMTIDRVPSLENPSGLGIEQWISTAPAAGN